MIAVAAPAPSADSQRSMEARKRGSAIRLNPWQPETDKLVLAKLGKLLEELGECTSAASRCIIQGFGEHNPDEGCLNAEWLAKEMADVVAAMSFVGELVKASTEFEVRVDMKIDHLKRWHSLITDVGRAA